jgi:hypothetical protein
MRDNKQVERIFRCPVCPIEGKYYETKWRYRLKDHLITKHKMRKRVAADIAMESEWLKIPRYVRADYYFGNPDYDDEDDDD